jgi:oligopeptide transport system substrate-binding protein
VQSILTFISILLIIFSLNSCTKKRDPGQNILRLSISGEIPSLDPANAYDTISGSIVYQVYEQLYQYHYLKRPYTLIPLLAEALPSVDKNGTRYTIKIKKGIPYHDSKVFGGKTRYLKAQDFVTQIKRLAYIPTKSNGWWLFDNRIKGLNQFRNSVGRDFEKFKTTPVSGLQTPDDHTLVIELTSPYPQMLYSLAMSFTTPVPLEAMESSQNNLNEVHVGTGPFKVKSWNPIAGAKLTRFASYRPSFYPTQGDRLSNQKGLLEDAGKKIPFLNEVHYEIIKESQSRWLNFRAKKIDVLKIPKDNFPTAIDGTGKLALELQKENIQLNISPTLTYWWLSFNMKDPLLGKNKNLRLAIAHAVNVSEYIKIFTNNVAQKANSIYPPGVPGYNPTQVLPYKYDLKEAAKYLALAGYPEGKGLPVINYDVRGASATARQQAEFIKQNLAKSGIKIKTHLNTFPAFLKKAHQGKLQFWQDGWAMDYPDAENILQLLISNNHPPGPNVTYFDDPQFNKYFQKLRYLEDGAEKFELMSKMEKIIHDNIPWVMEYYARNYVLIHENVKNYRQSDLIYNNMKYIRLR